MNPLSGTCHVVTPNMNSKGEREKAGSSYLEFFSQSKPVLSSVPGELSSSRKGSAPRHAHSKLFRPGGQQTSPWPLNVGVEEVIKHCKVDKLTAMSRLGFRG